MISGNPKQGETQLFGKVGIVRQEEGPGGRRAYQGFLGRGVGISASRASASASSGIHFGLRHPLRGHLFGRQALTFSMPAPFYLSRFPSEIYPTALNLKRVIFEMAPEIEVA